MKLIHFLYKNEEHIGILNDDNIKILDVKDFYELVSKYNISDLKKLDLEIIDTIKRSDILPLAFINHSKYNLICAGMNYYSHKDECINLGLDKKERNASVYFTKKGTNIITSGDILDRHKDITKECDYEGELGVILYKDLYKASKEDILNSIFGYVIINDVSARDLQRYHTQYFLAKSLDTYTIMSEVLLLNDFNDYQIFNIKTYINNELRQDDNTSNMIYSIEEMLEELSMGMTLECGTILSTGTPSGVGMGQIPKSFLNSGDLITIEIDKIGKLKNICK